MPNKMVQLDFFGNKKIPYSCCHCRYEGYDFDEVTVEAIKMIDCIIPEKNLEVCPKCGWALYSVEEVKRKKMWKLYSIYKKKGYDK